MTSSNDGLIPLGGGGSHVPVIYETANFVVYAGSLTMDPAYKGIDGYKMRNKRTGMIEQETNSEAMAIRLCHRSEQMLTEVLEDPDGTKAEQKQPPEWVKQLAAQEGPDDDDFPGGLLS
jgi:hypothetical protein